MAFDFDVGLIHTPGVADWPCVMIPALFKLRDILLHPPKNSRMGQSDAALGHHLDKVAGAEFKGQVPPHAQHDDLLVKMPPLEEILCRGRFRHPGRYGSAPVFSSVCTRTGRGIPDVAANASPNSGYPIPLATAASQDLPNPFPGSGTSAAAPLWAGLIAVINAALGENVGFVNPTLYEIGSAGIRDIVGAPGPVDNRLNGVTGYPAGAGWDACTGWGSIDGNALLLALRAPQTLPSWLSLLLLEA